MILYRNISIEELNSLLLNKKIEGKIFEENEDSGYRKELGPVVMFFAEPRNLTTHGYDALLKCRIPKDRIVGEGIAKYHMVDKYAIDEPYIEHSKEVYVREYSLKDIIEIEELFPSSIISQDILEFSFYLEDLGYINTISELSEPYGGINEKAMANIITEMPEKTIRDFANYEDDISEIDKVKFVEEVLFYKEFLDRLHKGCLQRCIKIGGFNNEE